MKYFLFCFFLLFTFFLSAQEIGIKHFDKNIIKDAVLEKELNGKDGIIFFNEQKFNGTAVKYYSNGTLALAEVYKNGIRNGFSYSWYENGSPKSEFYFLNDKKHGICITWYQNGQMQMLANHSYGKINGEFKAWDEEGTLVFEMFHVDDSQQDSYEQELQEQDGDSKGESRE